MAEVTQEVTQEDIRQAINKMLDNVELCNRVHINRIRILQHLQFLWTYMPADCRDKVMRFIELDPFSLGAWFYMTDEYPEQSDPLMRLNFLRGIDGINSREFEHGMRYAKKFLKNGWK